MGSMKDQLGDNLWIPTVIPDFDGATYSRTHDHKRLGKQYLRVFEVMSDNLWHTLNEISAIIDAPPASVSARLRDLRREKFGSHVVERRRVAGGLFEYRLSA